MTLLGIEKLLQRYVPEGTITVPPPLAEAAFKAALRFAVSVAATPVAAGTVKVPAGIVGNTGSAKAAAGIKAAVNARRQRKQG